MQFNYSPQKTKSQIDVQVIARIDSMVTNRLNAIEAKLLASANVLDGVNLEELMNFSVPLTGAQTPEQLHDGVLLGYKDGKLVEETDLNGGTF